MPLTRSSARVGQSPIATQVIADYYPEPTNPPPPPARMPKCRKGDRHKVPGDEFDEDPDDDEDHPDFFLWRGDQGDEDGNSHAVPGRCRHCQVLCAVAKRNALAGEAGQPMGRPAMI